MEHTPREANSSSDSQGILFILWKPNVHCRVHNSPPLVHLLRQLNPAYATPYYLLKIYFNIVPSTSRFWKLSISFRFLHQNLVRVSRLCHTCYMPAHHIFLFITRKIVVEDYELWRLWLWSFLKYRVTSLLPRAKLFLNALFSNIVCLFSPDDDTNSVKRSFFDLFFRAWHFSDRASLINYILTHSLPAI